MDTDDHLRCNLLTPAGSDVWLAQSDAPGIGVWKRSVLERSVGFPIKPPVKMRDKTERFRSRMAERIQRVNMTF